MIETKAEKDVSDRDVQEKAKAAQTFCERASLKAKKEWNYLIIPHGSVQFNMSFKGLIERFI